MKDKNECLCSKLNLHCLCDDEKIVHDDKNLKVVKKLFDKKMVIPNWNKIPNKNGIINITEYAKEHKN
ncbi:CLUMA_CG018624, isoform A [Clunio marinus]|uniref:CLUMA_CG018624, isoform A n=1 Tax=Clunio marinus TaxID=568069 RepID=A0A1J1J0P0_9DIPT|nr:CLUMA_CG018624, isoform A [Clunio marinus]